MNSEKGKRGPADESEENSGPDDERERVNGVVGVFGASNEERGEVGNDSTILSAVAGSSEPERGCVCCRCGSGNSDGVSTASSAVTGACGALLAANSYLYSFEGRGGARIGCIECRGSGVVTEPLDRGGLE